MGASTSTAAARSLPTWSSSGRTSFPSTRLRGSQAAQDRHEALIAAHRPSRVRRSAPGPHDPPRRPQHASRKARRPPVRPAGREGNAHERPFQRDARPQRRSGWGGEAPLWFYILREASCAVQRRATRAGGRPDHDRGPRGPPAAGSNSYPYLDPAWKPGPPIAPVPGVFTFVDLLRYAGAA